MRSSGQRANKKIALTRGHFGHQGEKGQVLHTPPTPRETNTGCFKQDCGPFSLKLAKIFIFMFYVLG